MQYQKPGEQKVLQREDVGFEMLKLFPDLEKEQVIKPLDVGLEDW